MSSFPEKAVKCFYQVSLAADRTSSQDKT